MFLPDLIHPVKFEKTNFVNALGEYLLEGREILATHLGNKQVS
jgi:hypothetical protein